jgi:hypothetical protein
MSDKGNGNIEIPDYIMERLASYLLPKVREYYKRPGVQEEYEKWLSEREAEKAEQSK